MWSCPRISSCIQIASSTRVWDWMVLWYGETSSSLSASSMCITFSSWSSCGLWSLSPNRPWSPGTIVVMWICQWLTSFSQWCSRLRRRAQCRQSSSTTRSPLSTSNTTTCTVSLCVERERERERGGEFMCVHVYEGERRVNTLCLLYENSFPLRNTLKIKDLKSW